MITEWDQGVGSNLPEPEGRAGLDLHARTPRRSTLLFPGSMLTNRSIGSNRYSTTIEDSQSSVTVSGYAPETAKGQRSRLKFKHVDIACSDGTVRYRLITRRIHHNRFRPVTFPTAWQSPLQEFLLKHLIWHSVCVSIRGATVIVDQANRILLQFSRNYVSVIPK